MSHFQKLAESRLNEFDKGKDLQEKMKVFSWKISYTRMKSSSYLNSECCSGTGTMVLKKGVVVPIYKGGGKDPMN